MIRKIVSYIWLIMGQCCAFLSGNILAHHPDFVDGIILTIAMSGCFIALGAANLERTKQ